MKILQYNEIKKEKENIVSFKTIDPDFSFEQENEKLFYITVEDEICGYAVLKLNGEAELERIFIVPKLRNNGYGTMLLKYLINWLINNNFNSLIVINHKKMNNFLEKQKFLKTGNGYELNNLSEMRKHQDKMISVSKFAIVVNVVLAILKIVSGNIFKSVSLISDGVNSLSDLITNILVIIGLKVGGNPEDMEHPFGHGKIESVFSVIIGTFIMLTAFDIIKENIGSLFTMKVKATVNSPIPIFITVLVIIIKIFQLMFMKSKIKDSKGALINSLMEDYKADILVSLSVLAGILLSWINPIFDLAVGLLVALYIIYTGYNLIRENSLILLDSQDIKLLESIKRDIFSFKEIKNAHDFRMTTSGKDIYISVDVRMDQDMTIRESHEISDEISKFIKHKYINIKRVLIHVEPVYD